MAGYSILGFYPVGVMHSFKFIRFEMDVPSLWLWSGLRIGQQLTASALDVVHPEGKDKGKKAPGGQFACQIGSFYL